MNTIDMSFTFDDAKDLTKKMHARYGDGFARQWKGFTANEIANEFFEEISGMTVEQIARGIAKMKTHEFAPNISQFSNWCHGDLKSKWLGANEAWNIARGSIDFNGNELTVVWTRECAIAFYSVSHLVRLGDKYQIAEAKKAFTEMYDRLVSESLEKRLQPVYEVSYGDDKEQRKTALKEAEIAGFLKSSESNNLIEMIQSPEDAKKEEIKFKTTAQEHLAKLKEVLKKPNQKQVEELKEKPVSFILSNNLPEWADPFDQPEQYKLGFKNDKKAIPLALTEWEKKNGIGG